MIFNSRNKHRQQEETFSPVDNRLRSGGLREQAFRKVIFPTNIGEPHPAAFE